MDPPLASSNTSASHFVMSSKQPVSAANAEMTTLRVMKEMQRIPVLFLSTFCLEFLQHLQWGSNILPTRFLSMKLQWLKVQKLVKVLNFHIFFFFSLHGHSQRFLHDFLDRKFWFSHFKKCMKIKKVCRFFLFNLFWVLKLKYSFIMKKQNVGFRTRDQWIRIIAVKLFLFEISRKNMHSQTHGKETWLSCSKWLWIVDV